MTPVWITNAGEQSIHMVTSLIYIYYIPIGVEHIRPFTGFTRWGSDGSRTMYNDLNITEHLEMNSQRDHPISIVVVTKVKSYIRWMNTKQITDDPLKECRWCHNVYVSKKIFKKHDTLCEKKGRREDRHKCRYTECMKYYVTAEERVSRDNHEEKCKVYECETTGCRMWFCSKRQTGVHETLGNIYIQSEVQTLWEKVREHRKDKDRRTMGDKNKT